MKAVAAVALAALVSSTSCGYIVKHPPLAAAIAGATIGFVSCEIGDVKVTTCAAVGGAAAGGLALVAFVAQLIHGSDDQPPPPSDDEQIRRLRPHIVPLPAPPLDAGVDAGPTDAAPADGAPADGG